MSDTLQERLALILAAQEHVLAQENGKDRLLKAVQELYKAFALAVLQKEALRTRDDVACFQTVQASLAKWIPSEVRPCEVRTEDKIEHAIHQVVSCAVAPEGVVDIFAAAGRKKPDISILSAKFLAEVQNMPHKSLVLR